MSDGAVEGRNAPAPISRGEMRLALTTRPPEQVWQAVLGWSAAVQPFWLEAIRRFAEVADLPDDRRDRHLTAASSTFGRMDDWWHGRVKFVKARRSEIDSAIGFVWNTALRSELRFLVQAPVARHVGPALRSCLHLAAGSYHPQQLPGVAAALVYQWAECRTLFPGDSSVLLQHRPPEDCEPGGGVAGEDHGDDFQRLYGAAADLFDLRREADAVCAEARAIWERFDEPAAWELPDDLWTRRYDGRYDAMRDGAIKAFHERA